MPAYQTVTARAPGKLILMGEHAAVYGRPALVAALGLYSRATIRFEETVTGAGDRQRPVRWDLPDIDQAGRSDWAALVEDAARFRRAWERQQSDHQRRDARPGSSELERLRRRDPARIVKLALAEALSAEELDLPAAAVRVRSELPVGAGFGSSASVAVVVGAALRVLLDGELRLESIERIARQVERREHGRPSGIDHTTVLHGGVLWMERSPTDDLVRRRLAGVGAALDGLAVFDSGRPAESTGEVVEAVRRRFAERSRELEAILDAMESDVRALGDWLGEERGEPRLLVELLRDFERRLEALDVVPSPVQELVRRIEASGGAAKISGAGALSGTAAGSLLVYHPERPPRSLGCLAGLRPLEAGLGVAGVEVEEAA